MNDKIKKLDGIVKMLRLFKSNFYWVKTIKNIYKLSSNEMGYIILKLKK